MFRFALNNLSLLHIPDSDSKIVRTTCNTFSVVCDLIDGLHMRAYLHEMSFGIYIMEVVGTLQCKDNKVANFGKRLDVSLGNVLW